MDGYFLKDETIINNCNLPFGLYVCNYNICGDMRVTSSKLNSPQDAKYLNLIRYADTDISNMTWSDITEFLGVERKVLRNIPMDKPLISSHKKHEHDNESHTLGFRNSRSSYDYVQKIKRGDVASIQ